MIYRSKYAEHSLSRPGRKPISFHRGEFKTDDPDDWAFIESHASFKNGIVVRVEIKRGFLKGLFGRK